MAVPMHVDAAIGGFVAPFIHPDLRWDFRFPQCGLDQRIRTQIQARLPERGLGRLADREQLSDELVFHVNYLGGNMSTFTLNVSGPGNQIVGQYYNFLRLGREGYTRVMTTLNDLATDLSARLICSAMVRRCRSSPSA